MPLTLKNFNKTPFQLCFKANTAGSTVQLTKNGSPTSVTIETSTDGTNWSAYTMGNTITLSNIGDKIYFRNTSETNTGFSLDGGNYYKFVMTGSIAGSGDTTSLLNKNGTKIISSNNCFRILFNGCSSLTTAPELPATTLTNYCYSYMFNNCSSLRTAPSLPATTIAQGCYFQMFNGCSSLTTAPELPATTLADDCYASMFNNCASLVTPPALPATNLASECYNSMFINCTSLTTCPSLPATTLYSYCYSGMFYNCTALTTLPKLPATTLPSICYQQMFRNCTNIKLSTTQTGEYQTAYRIPTTGTGTLENANALINMFGNTGGTFTGTPSINTTYYTSNTVV